MLDSSAIAGAVAWLLSPAAAGTTGAIAAGGRRLEPAMSVAVRYAPGDVAGGARALERRRARRRRRLRRVRRRHRGGPRRRPDACSWRPRASSAVPAPRCSTRSTASTRPGRDARVVGGIGWELCERLLGSGQAFERPNTYGAGTGVTYEPEALKFAWDEIVGGAGARVLHHARLIAVVTDGRRVHGAIAGDQGRPAPRQRHELRRRHRRRRAGLARRRRRRPRPATRTASSRSPRRSASAASTRAARRRRSCTG